MTVPPLFYYLIEMEPVKTLASGMSWFYAIGDRKNGPVSPEQLDELLRAGTINEDTLVWRVGLTDWQPLKAARAANPSAIPDLKPTICAGCGRTFPPDDLIQLNRSWVCAGCKPEFLQRMTEGAAPSGSAVGLWRTNKILVTRSETPFPDRCVKCNAPAHGFRLKRVLYWQHPAYYLLIIISLLIFLIVALIVRKKAVLHVGLCDRHRAQRRQAIIIGCSGTLAGLAIAVIGGAAFSSGWLAFAGVMIFLVTAIYGGLIAPMVSAAKISGENVWIKGVHRDFLADLPEWSDS